MSHEAADQAVAKASDTIGAGRAVAVGDQGLTLNFDS